MARVSEGNRGFHRFCVTNFTDENHIWCLSHSTLQRRLESVGVKPHFSLIDDRLLMGMDVFNWVFYCDDMAGTCRIAMIDHCGKRGRFSRTRRTDDKNQPRLVIIISLRIGWESELLKGWNFDHDSSNDQPNGATLPEDIDTEIG